MTEDLRSGRLAVLLPPRQRTAAVRSGAIFGCAALVIALVAIAGVARSQGVETGPDSWVTVLMRWSPLLLGGFAFNIAISLIAMTIGTVLGAGLGIGLLSENAFIQRVSWCVMQFFRNSPWLVLLFFAMFLVPFQIRIGDTVIPLPGWIKACVGFSLPVMANVAEIVRGAVKSLPATQWEAAESLAFTRRQTMWMIILPQCFRRMLPPWMNLYSLITMATVLASVVGVSEMLTLTSDVHAAEGGRPSLFAPLYGFALVCFFLYCYPIGRLTVYLERRLHV
ncbi:ABC transporter permease subunit [Aurantimonas aggregata]|uniref:ABC transporter permease subunit n=1 Tax=Aurantimonas aggregata TaxID=2047720 RepID=A0A6L9MJL0_9HYPH|nr:amino acid ABC transporter permease [Aurantimonas aggregata]NDV87660.1 ABC transporter permease subunit [Aurantimonas aggregata]